MSGKHKREQPTDRTNENQASVSFALDLCQNLTCVYMRGIEDGYNRGWMKERRFYRSYACAYQCKPTCNAYSPPSMYVSMKSNQIKRLSNTGHSMCHIGGVSAVHTICDTHLQFTEKPRQRQQRGEKRQKHRNQKWNRNSNFRFENIVCLAVCNALYVHQITSERKEQHQMQKRGKQKIEKPYKPKWKMENNTKTELKWQREIKMQK